MGGMNVCQVDGDDAGRYNYVGLRAGVGSSFVLDEGRGAGWRLDVELAYTQKGSRMAAGNGEIGLQYVEMGVLLAYDGGRWRLGAGVSPGVKVGCSVTFGGVADAGQEELYRRFDWFPLTVSARYLVTDHVGVMVRWQASMVSVYDGSGPYRFFHWNHGAFNRLLTFGLVYCL